MSGAAALLALALSLACDGKRLATEMGAAGARSDAGSMHSDASLAPVDSGTHHDAAVTHDAGVIEHDSGTPTPSEDAGSDAGGPKVTRPEGVPETVLLDGNELSALRDTFSAGQATAAQQAALANLIHAADLALVAGTWSVTSKDAQFVVNGDPHLYTSWGPYWWPADAHPPNDLGTIGQCPYSYHDGMRNPNVTRVTDRHGLHASSEAILQLALAWYFTGNNAYADQAARVARTWYLAADTAMKPDMSYAQRSGPCGGGTAAGLIEASGAYLTDALDGLAILALDQRPDGWTSVDRDGMRTWLNDFMSFLEQSQQGQGENNAANNHGTWYDAMVSSILLFVGDSARATQVVEAAKTRRIDPQIKGDGAQPAELSRATSWHYSNYNAAALCRLAGVAAHVGVDLWGYQSSDGGSIVKAIEFLIATASSADGPGPWAQYHDIETPFDAVYKAEAYYTIRAAAQFAHSAAAAAVFAQNPVPMAVPGRYCDGSRFPTGSMFCGVSSSDDAFLELQDASSAVVDMWPLLRTCRVPIH